MVSGCTTEEEDGRPGAILKEEMGWELIESSRSLAVSGLMILWLRLVLQLAWSSLIDSSCFFCTGAIPEEIELKPKLYVGGRKEKLRR